MKEIELSKTGKKNKGKLAIIDDDVFEEVNKINWSYKKDGYVRGYDRSKKKEVLLHRFIWELKYGKIPKGKIIDHKDGNKQNCQIDNLRLATHSENTCNSKCPKNNTSGYKGISKYISNKKSEWRKEKWFASITKNYKTYVKLFPYTDEGLEEAIKWRERKAKELHKEFSIYNRLDKNK